MGFFFVMLFWFAALWLAFRVFRSWDSCRSRGFSGDRQLERRNGIDDQRPHIEALESRVTELEERLDFTERLVAERREVAS
jgi:hypothetical protein